MIRLLQNSFTLAHKIFPEGGTCLEFGVHVGNTFVWEAKEIQRHYKTSRLIGFDSWQGLPKEEKNVWFPQRHNQGEFAVTKDVVLQRLQAIGMANDPSIQFVDGFFEDSLTTKLQKQIHNLILSTSTSIFINLPSNC